VVFISPGVFLLAISRMWDEWRGVQRLTVLVALSIAFYPVFFYLLDILPLRVRLGPGFFVIFFVLGWSVTLLLWWKKKAAPQINGSLSLSLSQALQQRLTSGEWGALLLIGLTVATRLWVAARHPYPAWVDSLQHALLTKLITTQGVLPATLEPYDPIVLNMYHLGLHCIAAVTAWLSQAPYHSALLWTAQMLNGICGLGIYLALDRKVGRAAALIGMATVGLFSYQPAFYVNWGRFTQAASQSLLLIVWIVTYDAIKEWRQAAPNRRALIKRLWKIVFCGLLGAGMLLIHFRVAAFYLLLLAPSLVFLLVQSWRANTGAEPAHSRHWAQRLRRRQTVKLQLTRSQPGKGRLGQMSGAILGIGLCTLAFNFPGLWPALNAYLTLATAKSPPLLTASQIAESRQLYFTTTIGDILALSGQNWLLVVALAAAAVGVWKWNKLTLLSLLWLGLLCLLGSTYWLGIQRLNIVNLSGVAIMFYLPIALLIGAGFQPVLDWLEAQANRWQTRRPHALFKPDRLQAWAAAVFVLAALPAAQQRIQAIEPFRYFVTPADVEAFAWINEHLPEDARFAINTTFWLPNVPHGTDAGYWIPYFTDRKITAAPAILGLADPAYQNQIIQLARLASTIVHDPLALSELYKLGVHYIYIGAKGNYTESNLEIAALQEQRQVKLLYAQADVAIFEILP
jgi:hypothetical protein